MATYSPTDYLLDRANIHDTVTKLYLLTDLKLWDRLAAEVPAETITLDYSALFGSPPSPHSPASLVEQWKALIAKMTTTQHIITSLLIELPQPGAVEKPTKAKVTVNVHVNLVREGMVDGDRTGNGGRAEFELVKQEREGNPWRITLLKALEGSWVTGNMQILTD